MEEEKEVDFPNQGAGQSQRQTVQTGKQPHKPIVVKNLNLIHAPRRGKSGFAEIAKWNCSARQGAHNETKRGWMARRVGDQCPETTSKETATGIPCPLRNLLLSKIYLFSDLNEGISTVCATGSTG